MYIYNIYIYIYTYVCVYVSIHMCMHACMCKTLYRYPYVYMYIDTFLHPSLSLGSFGKQRPVPQGSTEDGAPEDGSWFLWGETVALPVRSDFWEASRFKIRLEARLGLRAFSPKPFGSMTTCCQGNILMTKNETDTGHNSYNTNTERT